VAAWWLFEPPPHCAFGTMSHEHKVLVVGARGHLENVPFSRSAA